MQAIDQRQSGRFYDKNRAVDDQTLSEILWVAWGANSHGKRTIATARNLQNMGLYLLTKDGTWKYDGQANTLEKVNDKNLIPLCATQDFVNDAPVHLLSPPRMMRGAAAMWVPPTRTCTCTPPQGPGHGDSRAYRCGRAHQGARPAGGRARDCPPDRRLAGTGGEISSPRLT